MADRVTAASIMFQNQAKQIDLDALHIEIEAVESGAVATIIVGNRPTQDESAES